MQAQQSLYWTGDGQDQCAQDQRSLTVEAAAERCSWCGLIEIQRYRCIPILTAKLMMFQMTINKIDIPSILPPLGLPVQR